jgi:aspartate oxidase
VSAAGPFDVLVIGSGASGLAAAVSAERAGARVALATKGSLQSCNSAKAQGGIQAAFGDDDSPEQHAADVWSSSHETADKRLVEILTSEAPSAIHWLEELGVEFTRENGGYRLARCGGATRKRLLQVGDRTGHAITAVLLNAEGEEFTDSLGPRDAVSQAIFDEVENGKGVETPDGRPAVYLDTTRIAEDDANVSLPYMLRRYRAAGHDPLSEKIFTYPVLHYQNGGLVIDPNAETTLEGVYACGEIAGGTHGRNRMMGNSLLECCVFGRRAGRAAAERARA